MYRVGGRGHGLVRKVVEPTRGVPVVVWRSRWWCDTGKVDKYRQNESESRLKPKVKVELIVNATVTIVKFLYGSAYVAEKVSSIRL